MLHVKCHISSVEFFPEVPQGAFLSTRIFVQPFKDSLQHNNRISKVGTKPSLYLAPSEMSLK